VGDDISPPASAIDRAAGAHIHSRRELRKLWIEPVNDRRLVDMTLVCCGIGTAYAALWKRAVRRRSEAALLLESRRDRPCDAEGGDPGGAAGA
jgi:hypothetical protein